MDITEILKFAQGHQKEWYKGEVTFNWRYNIHRIFLNSDFGRVYVIDNTFIGVNPAGEFLIVDITPKRINVGIYNSIREYFASVEDLFQADLRDQTNH